MLAETLRAPHPDSRLTVLVIDGPADPSDCRLFRALAFEDLVADPAERQRLAFMYNVTATTALKPLLFRRLLNEGAEFHLFDPDIQVFDSVADLWSLARDRGIALTPHVLSPIPDDGLGVSDLYVSRAGQYNLGFLGLGAGEEAFLEWWWGRLRRHCVSAPEAGMFVDQRWVDFVPSLFPARDRAGPRLGKRRVLEPAREGSGPPGRAPRGERAAAAVSTSAGWNPPRIS